MPLATARMWITTGAQPRSICYDFPTTWHHLTQEGVGTWMTDKPIEQAQIDECLRGMRGSVLVGGLGLGYAALVLCRRKSVRRVVVVEISPEVVQLVEPALRRSLGRDAHKLTVITAELFEYLHSTTKRFSYGFYDIWQSDGERTFQEVVLPLYAASRKVLPRDPVCWNEDVMRGQLRNGLVSAATVAKLGNGSITLEMLCKELPKDDPSAIWVNWRVPFFRWCARHRDRDLSAAANIYAGLYGRREWREQWEAYGEGDTDTAQLSPEFGAKAYGGRK